MNYTITKFLDIKPENLKKIKVLNYKIDVSEFLKLRSRERLHLEIPLSIIPKYMFGEEEPITQLLDFLKIDYNVIKGNEDPITITFTTYNSTMTELSFVSWLVTDIKIDDMESYAEVRLVADIITNNTIYLN